ncbi:MAG: ATP-binding cassette domain-containing protein [Clostridia bacterium]|nr:ATP-binding cassette domain-containing protein [Clostridia bacterium]
MTVISVNSLSLSYGPKTILDGVSFALDAGDRAGIVGPNGCGKTSLLKLILGEEQPDSGSVYIAKDRTVGVLGQAEAFEVSKDTGITVLEQMYSAFPELIEAEKRLAELSDWLMRHPELSETEKHSSITNEYSVLSDRFNRDGGHWFRGRCKSVLEKMGFSPDDMQLPVTSLSGGQRTRLALSKQLCREPDILMLDEPTNHLDIETVGWLENFLAGYQKCVIAVSHDRYFLDRVTNKTLVISHRHAKLYNGNYTASAAQRRTDREIQERHYINQQREIARQEAYIEQQRRWNRERNIIAAESRQKLLDKMEKIEAPEKDEKTVKMRFLSGIPSGNDVIETRNLSFAYPGAAPLFHGLDFKIRRGERVFITGPNGCGKSTLMRLLLEKLRPTSGVIDFGHNLEIGYYDQENQNLNPSFTVLEDLWSKYPAMAEKDVRRALGTFLFRGDDVFKEVSVLSGGERARLTLAKLMLMRVNTLLLDEPTNHLDIGSREALEEALGDFDGTLVCVSHDRSFINALATVILGFGNDGKLYRLPVSEKGKGWDEWEASRNSGMFASAAGRTDVRVYADDAGDDQPLSQKEAWLKRKKDNAEARKNSARIERLKKEQQKLENEIDEMNSELFGDAAGDYQRAAALTESIEKAEERLLEIYEELDSVGEV